MAPEETSSAASAAAPAAATRQWGLRGSARSGSPAPVARGNASGGAGRSPPQPRSSGGGGGGRGRWTWWPLLATALAAVVLLQARATAALWRRAGELAALREEVAAAVLAALLARSAAGQVAAGEGAAGDMRPLPAGWQGGGWGVGSQQAPRHLVQAFCGSPSAAAAVAATAASFASATASARGAAFAASAPAAAAAPPGRAPDLLASLQQLCSAAGLLSTPASAASGGGGGGASGPGLLTAAGEVLLAALLAAVPQTGGGAASGGASTALTGTLLGPPRGDIEVAEAAGAAAAGGRRMGRGRNEPNNAALGDGSSGDDSGSSDGGGGGGPSILVGVFTGPNPGGRPTPDPRHDSALRRAAIRGSWLWRRTRGTPATAGAPAAGPRAAGANAGAGGVGSLTARAGGEVVVRFVVGEVVNDTAGAEALAAEAERHGDFMRLPGVQECYTCLPHKTRSFFAAAVSAFPSVRFVVKADDDVYLLPHRLPAAAQQWGRMGADYIGCMTHGPVRSDPEDRWFEPQSLLLGPAYFLHAYGSAYVLSARAVRDVVVARFERLRLLANEDTSVGAWMLGADVAHFEDMRLCAPGCHPAALALAPVGCAGLCDPVADMAAAAANTSCTSDAPVPLPYMPSYPEHVAFERMWV
ncbi:hypothetical protein HYH03_006303 [Edaphochlamys debaryana]|uniref:Uncharacterized protein n=1 Tax=Edaphochlamys debaryana TaxID=47281 RepID=A0A836C1J9_9CHLO|nr:hypothetical protein HYH03_006303 [Edaphochlamys debaryana]|eukprot:KAG2495703.1 hypothetical protein HYH03_006303 [Edaphochlamys debaryana]